MKEHGLTNLIINLVHIEKNNPEALKYVAHQAEPGGRRGEPDDVFGGTGPGFREDSDKPVRV
jgi:hypothetical protein